MSRPTKATVSGRAFLSLQREAKTAGRTTAEYLRLYALEGFLLRLAHSPHRNRFVLKGGVLLAAYGLRRPTADIDGAALQTSNEAEDIRQFVIAVASTALPAELDDGLTFDLDNVTAEAIRDEDKYGGVRIRLVARLASAREPFHVDVNIGDPIWPEPAEISLPRLLGQEPIQLRGYSMEMVLAEKIVTALQRGSASTRWRDFGDIFVITGRLTFKAGEVRQALQAVADYRHVELANLDDARRRVCRNRPAEVGIMAAQTPAHRDPSRTLRANSRIAKRLREPDHHRLHHRSGDLGSRPTRMEPRGLANQECGRLPRRLGLPPRLGGPAPADPL